MPILEILDRCYLEEIVFHLLPALNSTLNPVIYFWRMKPFRRLILERFGRGFPIRGQTGEGQTGGGQTGGGQTGGGQTGGGQTGGGQTGGGQTGGHAGEGKLTAEGGHRKQGIKMKTIVIKNRYVLTT